MNFQPLQDRVLVKRTESSDKTKGGLFIPDNAKEKPQEGVISAVGTGRALDNGTVLKPAVKEGDKVLFGKYSGTDIKLEDQEYLILKEDDILGIIK